MMIRDTKRLRLRKRIGGDSQRYGPSQGGKTG